MKTASRWLELFQTKICFSLDSGRASNSNSNSNSTTDSSFHSIHPIREHLYPVRGNSLGLPPPVIPMGRMSSIGSVGSSSFRQSYHSSSSSLGSVERAEDSICALDIQEMTADGVPVSQTIISSYFSIFSKMNIVGKIEPPFENVRL